MPNFKIKLKLKQLSGSFLMDIQGKTTSKKCLCIPVEDNHLFISENSGEVYLDLVAFEVNNEYHSHSIKRSLSKAEYDSMTEEQRKAMPFVGDMDELGKKQPNPQPQAGDPYPNPQPSQQYEGDLPF